MLVPDSHKQAAVSACLDSSVSPYYYRFLSELTTTDISEIKQNCPKLTILLKKKFFQ